MGLSARVCVFITTVITILFGGFVAITAWVLVHALQSLANIDDCSSLDPTGSYSLCADLATARALIGPTAVAATIETLFVFLSVFGLIATVKEHRGWVHVYTRFLIGHFVGSLIVGIWGISATTHDGDADSITIAGIVVLWLLELAQWTAAYKYLKHLNEVQSHQTSMLSTDAKQYIV